MSYPINNEVELYLFIEKNNLLSNIVEKYKESIKTLLLQDNKKLLDIQMVSKEQEEEILRLKSENIEQLRRIEEEKMQLNIEKELLKKKEILINNIEKVKERDTASSYGIGETFELSVQLSIENHEMIHEYWDIDGDKKNHCMDIRLQHKDYKNCSIGIELKDKQSVTSEDIKKFETDKVKNNFTGNIFISKTPVLNIKKIDTTSFYNNNLIIVSNNIGFITNCIYIYIQSIEHQVKNDVDVDNTNDNENIMLLYKHNQALKRQLKKGDELYLEILKHNCEENEYKKILGRHLYILTRSESKKIK